MESEDVSEVLKEYFEFVITKQKDMEDSEISAWHTKVMGPLKSMNEGKYPPLGLHEVQCIQLASVSLELNAEGTLSLSKHTWTLRIAPIICLHSSNKFVVHSNNPLQS